MSTSDKAPGRPAGSTPEGARVVRVNRADAASIALKVALNERAGKVSPRWMLDVAEQMGVRPSRA